MYRAVTLAALRADVDLTSDAALAGLVEQLEVSLPPGKVMLGEEDVTESIRSCGGHASHHGSSPTARAFGSGCRSGSASLPRPRTSSRKVATRGRWFFRTRFANTT